MNPEEPQDFEDMMKDADQEMEANQTEDEIVERAPQLKQLSESIDNAFEPLTSGHTFAHEPQPVQSRTDTAIAK